MSCDHEHAGDNTFGRLFPEETHQPTEEQLIQLSETMKEPSGSMGPDAETPIGFAFLGQFIDHDITLDATTTLGRVSGDVTQIENLRTPRLELDSVYLNGPEGSPYLYHEDKIILGTYENPYDFQRNRYNTAIIGDPRNDENLFIAQLHGLFIRFHNALIDRGMSFEDAQRHVRWTYQWIVVHEFLPAIIAPELLASFIDGFNEGALPNYNIDWEYAPAIPVEFSAAAYRFGHSHVRQDYQVNHHVAGDLFDFPAFMPVAIENNIDWRFFFDIDGISFKKARPIDTRLAPTLFELPFAPDLPSLAARNLLRGQRTFLLPYGEDIAERLGVEQPLPTPPIVNDLDMKGTPLWYYVLAEAEASHGKLDKVGGILVCGTLLQMLLRDRQSYVNASPDFHPLRDVGGSCFAEVISNLPDCEALSVV